MQEFVNMASHEDYIPIKPNGRENRIPWDIKTQHSLIERARKHRVLWDHTHELFSKKNLKRSGWCMVATSLRQEYPELAAVCLNEDDVREKFAKLKSSFQREVKRIHNSSSGYGGDKSKWEFFKAFSFMLPVESNGHRSSLLLPPSHQVVLSETEPVVVPDHTIPTIIKDDPLADIDESFLTISDHDLLKDREEDVGNPPLDVKSNLPEAYASTPLPIPSISPTASTASSASGRAQKRKLNELGENNKEFVNDTVTRERNSDDTANRTADLVRSFLNWVSEPQRKKMSLKIFNLIRSVDLSEDDVE